MEGALLGAPDDIPAVAAHRAVGADCAVGVGEAGLAGLGIDGAEVFEVVVQAPDGDAAQLDAADSTGL